MAMLITKFHKLIRSRLLWGCFLVIVIFTFVVWGTQMPAANKQNAEASAPGFLDGKPVPADEFRKIYMDGYLAVILSVGRVFNITPEIDKQLREAAWQRLVSLRQAQSLGLGASKDEIGSAIEQQPIFRDERGQFSVAGYKQFVTQFLSQLGFTEKNFEDYIRDEIALQKLRAVLARTVLIAPQDVRRTFSSVSDKFKIQYVRMDEDLVKADVKVTVVDRRGAPGGHWVDAYPFVRLHTPSAYYGVSSLALGEDRIDDVGENAGSYERATGGEVQDYFAAVAARLAQTRRVRILTGHEHLGQGSDCEHVRGLDSGALHDVRVRRKVVDGRYLEASVPATHTPPFAIASGARFASVNDLPAAARSTQAFTVLGAGKTAVDACTWLLDNDVEPDRIRWVRPREMWFHDRAQFQPLEQVGGIIHGISLDAEAGA